MTLIHPTHTQRLQIGLTQMFVDILKFIHLLLTLSLLGLTFVCLISVTLVDVKRETLSTLNRIMLWLLVFSVLTGTLLVYPKHFTFHTPWIQAAYVLVFLCGTLISLLLVFKPRRFVWGISYLLLALLLLGVVRDAVTKTTLFLFLYRY